MLSTKLSVFTATLLSNRNANDSLRGNLYKMKIGRRWLRQALPSVNKKNFESHPLSEVAGHDEYRGDFLFECDSALVESAYNIHNRGTDGQQLIKSKI